MKYNFEMRIRCRAVNADDYARRGFARERWSPWKKNLVFDNGLNSFAGKTGSTPYPITPGKSFTNCQVGTSATANSIVSGGTLFTQVGTAITATGSFFTAGMVGAIIKYGSGSAGAEQYIVSQTGTACVVAGAGMTVSVGTAATVWLVQQTALAAPLLTTSTYQTSGSSCGTTYVANVITMQRTFNFAVQGSSYNANEIGWNQNASTSYAYGRLVLASTIVVATTQFLQVQMQLINTVSPASPAAVANVGTGINTAGTAALEVFPFTPVSSTGTANTGLQSMEPGAGNSNLVLSLQTGTTYTQNAAPSTTFLPATPNWATGIFTGTTGQAWVYTGTTTAPGTATLSFPDVFSTAAQTMNGIGITNGVSGSTIPLFDVKFTTPITLPTGSFQPQPVFGFQFSRTLVN